MRLISITAIDLWQLAVCYAMFSGNFSLLQERLDEEGCGAVFCSARLVPD